jgi:hypothetical protein
MPQAPLLPPGQMAQATSGAGLNPANFLMAAADLHGAGKLSSPIPTGRPLLPPANLGKRKALSRTLKVIR